jgi:hypothetical protein
LSPTISVSSTTRKISPEAASRAHHQEDFLTGHDRMFLASTICHFPLLQPVMKIPYHCSRIWSDVHSLVRYWACYVCYAIPQSNLVVSMS